MIDNSRGIGLRNHFLNKATARRAVCLLALLISAVPFKNALAQQPTLQTGPLTPVGAGYEFTRISQAALGPNRQIALAQPRDQQVLIFDLDNSARPVATAGRLGEGPGEFSSINNIGWLGSNLWATDGFMPRVEFFDQRGQVVASKRFERLPSSIRQVRYNGPMAILSDSATIYFPSVNTGPRALPPGTVDAAVPILLRRPRTESLDTLALIRPLRVLLILDGDLGASVGTQPMVASDFIKTGVDGQQILLVLQSGPDVEEGRVRVEVCNSSGTKLLSTDLGLQGRKLTLRGWDSLFTRYVNAYTGDTWSTKSLAKAGLKAALFKPRFLPIITDAVLGKDGTIWLRKELERNGEVEWLVLSSAGVVIGSVMLPATTRILDVTARMALGVTRDVDNLEHPFWMHVGGG